MLLFVACRGLQKQGDDGASIKNASQQDGFYFGSSASEYTALTAAEKQDLLFGQHASTRYQRLPPIGSTTIVDFAQVALSHVAGIIDPEDNSEIPDARTGYKHLTHKSGVVGKFHFVPNQEYRVVRDGERVRLTGLLSEPYTTGIIRLSVLSEPSLALGFGPSLALKFLIDGKVAANVAAMEEITGRYESDAHFTWDFFAYKLQSYLEISKHGPRRKLVSGPVSDKFLKAMQSVFPEEDFNAPLLLGVNHLFAINKDGSDVAHPIGTDEVFFVPGRYFAGQAWSRFRNSKIKHDFRDALATIPTGTAIYQVADKTGALMGEIVLDSPLSASQFGDQSLFFIHKTRRLKI
jgi:hypothetical protein